MPKTVLPIRHALEHTYTATLRVVVMNKFGASDFIEIPVEVLIVYINIILITGAMRFRKQQMVGRSDLTSCIQHITKINKRHDDDHGMVLMAAIVISKWP